MPFDAVIRLISSIVSSASIGVAVTAVVAGVYQVTSSAMISPSAQRNRSIDCF
jgi:hypothetical protein